jgi:hypothetical protein
MACLFHLALMNWMRSVGPPPQDGTLPVCRLIELAAKIGVTGKYAHLDWDGLMATRPTSPVIVLLKNGNLVLALGPGRAGAVEVAVWDPLNREGGFFFVTREAFEDAWSGDVVLTYAMTGSTGLQSRNWPTPPQAIPA